VALRGSGGNRQQAIGNCRSASLRGDLSGESHEASPDRRGFGPKGVERGTLDHPEIGGDAHEGLEFGERARCDSEVPLKIPLGAAAVSLRDVGCD
jgi:hypothetical protein